MLIALLLLLGCGPRVPPAPDLGEWSWEVDRYRLPAVDLEILHVGTVHLRDRLVRAGGGRSDHDGPISVLLVRHPRYGVVLVDAGYGRRTLADPAEYPGRAVARTIGLEMGRPVVDQLADRGIAAGDVRHVVLTHLHTDHAGGVEDFPKARLYVHEDEWAPASRRRPLRGYDPLPYGDRTPELLTFDGTGPYGPFEHHVDLFGDGAIVVLPSPGHTEGSVSVLVNLPSRSVLYVGDAAWVDVNWTEPAPKGFLPRTVVEHDWKLGMDALWRVRAWQARHPELDVMSGHDPQNLRSIP